MKHKDVPGCFKSTSTGVLEYLRLVLVSDPVNKSSLMILITPV